jgi:hypothetical protein
MPTKKKWKDMSIEERLEETRKETERAKEEAKEREKHISPEWTKMIEYAKANKPKDEKDKET